MDGMKNINNKLRISIFTALFLIGFVYSVYSQATSEQNNAVSSLESNLIIQELINSSFNGYSTAGQYFANFLSINNVPTSVWSIIIFFMTVLLFIGIYTFLFEIFIQRAGIKEKENETMRKAKILSVLALSLFSAIAIGYAIPFLLSLYGFILLILVLIALFFFGRAVISHGKSFYYTTKSFEVNVEKDFRNIENELKELRGKVSEKDLEYIKKGIEEIHNTYNRAKNASEAANKNFENALSNLSKIYQEFADSLRDSYEKFLETNKNNLNYVQKDKLTDFIRNLNSRISEDNEKLQKILKSKHPDPESIPSIRQLYRDILGYIQDLSVLDHPHKEELQKILEGTYRNTLEKFKTISPKIEEALKTYGEARDNLNTIYAYENTLKKNIAVRIGKIFGIPGNKEAQIAMLNEIEKLKNDIRRLENEVYNRIYFLEKLREEYTF